MLCAQIHLVETDQRCELTLLCSDQISVQQLQPQSRLFPGGDDQHLIDVGDNDLAQIVIKDVRAGEHCAPRENALDDAVSRGIERHEHLVAHGDHVSVSCL